MYGDASQAAGAVAVGIETAAGAGAVAVALPEVLPAPRNVAPGGGGITGEVVKAEELIITCGEECCQGGSGDDDCE